MTAHCIRALAFAAGAVATFVALSAGLGACPAVAQTPNAAADTAPRITFGAFVDGYYAYDFGEPPTRDRSFAGGALFTTQPARHNEFNVNLAFVEAAVSGPRYRGRLAVQTGTSVQANYSFEPAEGVVSGAQLAQLIQEAVVGVRIAEGLWVDGGIFYSNMGMESWVSRDNPTYTRSLVADYSPYYSTGVKLTWAATPQLTARLDVVNGWQNISENNDGKGAGLRLDYAPADGVTLSYYNFFSDESGTRLRTFNGVGAKVARGAWTLLGEADVGTQRRALGTDGTSTWTNVAGIIRYQLSPHVALSGRVEHASDPDQVVFSTGTRDGSGGTPVPNAAFRSVGGSVGLDVQPLAGSPRVLWRSELRGFRNRHAIFPDASGGAPSKASAFAVSSLALTF